MRSLKQEHGQIYSVYRLQPGDFIPLPVAVLLRSKLPLLGREHQLVDVRLVVQRRRVRFCQLPL
jgi:hypothetical protein